MKVRDFVRKIKVGTSTAVFQLQHPSGSVIRLDRWMILDEMPSDEMGRKVESIEARDNVVTVFVS